MGFSLDRTLVPTGTTNPGYQSNGYTVSGFGVGIIYAGSNIKEIAYNNLPPGTALTNTIKTLSGNDTANPAVLLGDNAFALRVDTAYNGVQFGVLYADRSASTFTATMPGGPASKQTLNNVGQELVTENIRRLANLGYL